jgi:hypothetical protein
VTGLATDAIGSVILPSSSRCTKWMVIMLLEVIMARASLVCVAGISLVVSGIAAQLPIERQSTPAVDLGVAPSLRG